MIVSLPLWNSLGMIGDLTGVKVKYRLISILHVVFWTKPRQFFQEFDNEKILSIYLVCRQKDQHRWFILKSTLKIIYLLFFKIMLSPLQNKFSSRIWMSQPIVTLVTSKEK